MDLPILKSACGNYYYVPAGCYGALVTETFVRDELKLSQNAAKESEKAKHDELVRFILDFADRVFLIVLSLNRYPDENLEYMKAVYEKKYTNSRLPFTLQMLVELGLAPTSRTIFELFQWQHLAPTFPTDDFLMRLDSQQPLPFTKMERRQGKDGATCDVYRVEVHPDHMNVGKLTTRSSSKYGTTLT
jgi:hypothetical protein